MRLVAVEDSRIFTRFWMDLFTDFHHEMTVVSSTALDIQKIDDIKPNMIFFGSHPKHIQLSEMILAFKRSPATSNARLVLVTSLDADEIPSLVDVGLLHAVLIRPIDEFRVWELVNRLEMENTRSSRKMPLAVVVDDSRVVRQLFTQQLAAIGIHAETAENGLDGKELIEKLRPDIALVDLEMPQMDGLEMCKAILANPSTRNIPIVIISGNVNARVAFKGFMSGTLEFLAKPVDPRLLRETVESLLKRKQVHQRRATAIVLEDSQLVAHMILQQLDTMGVETHWAKTAADFAATATVLVPDIISIDLTLPDGNGLEICRQIRKNKRFDFIPVMIVSGEADRDMLIECLNAGANDFLAKPFVKAEFRARVGNLLRLKQLQDSLHEKNRAMENLAYSDKLTSLYNRMYFDKILETELTLAQQQGSSLGLLLIDLDHFKKVNDTYGHPTGDEVLKEVALCISNTIRSADIACRYGGEELVVLLPGASAAISVTVAERIRERCESTGFTATNLHQTLSIGVSVYPATSTAESLVLDADKCLYVAKEKGRNSVALADIISPPVSQG
ncbi:MAG: diguanylate cyclase [Deltaproteobacteria bacterium]|nr:diguanylate cyclase [Deltaproteobacteria bacterium]